MMALTSARVGQPLDVSERPDYGSGFSHAAVGYDRLAPFYDRFTATYAYERWIAAIEERATALGLSGRRALDLACGTGKSTTPLLLRGYSVLACDISEEMIRQAQRNLPMYADAFSVADMRDLPALGQFDLVLCLDDAINYLLSDRELESTFAGVARLLSPDGIFVFDVNSLRTYRTAFAQPDVREEDGVVFAWRGEGSPGLEPGGISSASVEIFAERQDGLWERRSMRHVQRHHPVEAVHSALEQAGLRACATLGQHPGARFEELPDEERHIKLVHFAKRRTDCRGEVIRMETIQP
jgi:SAM-dependent methyltransferase